MKTLYYALALLVAALNICLNSLASKATGDLGGRLDNRGRVPRVTLAAPY